MMSKYMLLAVILGSLVQVPLIHSKDDIEEGWVEIDKSLDIVNNSFFPLKISYQQNGNSVTAYLPVDWGTGYEGPFHSIKNPETITGPITVAIAIPVGTKTINGWINWLQQFTSIDIKQTANEWRATLESEIPHFLDVENFFKNLLSIKKEFDPSSYAKNGAILHVIFPLIKALKLGKPWVIGMDHQGTADKVWRAIRLQTGKLVKTASTGGLTAYNVLVDWMTYDLPRLIKNHTITKESTKQEILDEVPPTVKFFDEKKPIIIEDYSPTE